MLGDYHRRARRGAVNVTFLAARLIFVFWRPNHLRFQVGTPCGVFLAAGLQAAPSRASWIFWRRFPINLFLTMAAAASLQASCVLSPGRDQ